METPLTHHRDSTLKGKEYLHYSDPVKAPAALSRFGPIAYSLANNHTLDQGAVGLNDTLKALDTVGAQHFGAGRDSSEATKPLLQMFRIGGTSFTVAIFGGLEYSGIYAEQFHFYADANHAGVAPVDVPAVEKAIRALRQHTSNLFVVYYMHVLQNYSWKSPFQVATAKALRIAGVDLVIGSGAHMMQEVENGGNQWIFYGLGNFVFNAAGRTSTFSVPPIVFFWSSSSRSTTVAFSLFFEPIRS
jgi:cyanophycin synthetase